METLDISGVVGKGPNRFVLARTRRLAAVVALAVPALMMVLIFLMARDLINGRLPPIRLLESPFFIAYLVPGSAALAFWCRRYIKPALRALGDDQPVYIEDGHLVIQRDSFPVEANMQLRFDQSALQLVADGKLLRTFPAFFTRIKPPA